MASRRGCTWSPPPPVWTPALHPAHSPSQPSRQCQPHPVPLSGGPWQAEGPFCPVGGSFRCWVLSDTSALPLTPSLMGTALPPRALPPVLPPSGDPTASPVPTSAAGVRGSARPSCGFCPGADVRFREAAPEPLVTKPSSASHGRRAVSASRRDHAHVLGCAVGGGGPQTPLPEGPCACGTDLRARCRGDRRLLRARSWAGG